jgi:hypothetical protein
MTRESTKMERIGNRADDLVTIPLFGLAGAVVGGFIGWMFRTE